MAGLRDRESGFFGYVALVGVLALVVCVPALAGLPAFLWHAPATFWLLGALAVLCDAVAVRPAGRRPDRCCCRSRSYRSGRSGGWAGCPWYGTGTCGWIR